MCDRCEIDMLMYGETVRCEVPVWEKGRFQAETVEEKSPDCDGSETASETDVPKARRDQE